MAKQFDKQWYPFYHDLFNRSTAGWNAERVGAYILLLNHQWQNNGIPIDREELLFIAKCTPEILDRVLLKFEIEKQGRFFNKKMEIIRKEQIGKYEKRANAGKAGGIAKKQNSSNATTMLQQNHSIENKNKTKDISKEIDKKELKEKAAKKPKAFIAYEAYLEMLKVAEIPNAVKNALAKHFKMREAKKWQLTEFAAELVISTTVNIFKKHGEADTVDCVNASTKGDWKDIYPPKTKVFTNQQQQTQSPMPHVERRALTNEQLREQASQALKA